MDDLGDFADLETTENAEFDNVCLPRIELGETGEDVVQGDDVQSILTAVKIVGYGDERRTLPPVSLERRTLSGIVDEHLAHRTGCRGEKMCAIFPLCRVLIGESEKRFVYEAGRLKRVIVTLAVLQAVRNGAQFRVKLASELPSFEQRNRFRLQFGFGS